MSEFASGRPAALAALRTPQPDPSIPPPRNVVDRLRQKWPTLARSLTAHDRQHDVDDLLRGLNVYQRLKSLRAIDATTEHYLLGWFDAYLDG